MRDNIVEISRLEGFSTPFLPYCCGSCRWTWSRFSINRSCGALEQTSKIFLPELVLRTVCHPTFIVCQMCDAVCRQSENCKSYGVKGEHCHVSDIATPQIHKGYVNAGGKCHDRFCPGFRRGDTCGSTDKNLIEVFDATATIGKGQTQQREKKEKNRSRRDKPFIIMSYSFSSETLWDS